MSKKKQIPVTVPASSNAVSASDKASAVTSKPWFTYILRCEDNSLYTGITTDPERRFNEHARKLGKTAGSKGDKGAKYTAVHRPVSIVALFTSATRSEASRLEYRIKKLTHADKEALISGMMPAWWESDIYTFAEIPTSATCKQIHL